MFNFRIKSSPPHSQKNVPREMIFIRHQLYLPFEEDHSFPNKDVHVVLDTAAKKSLMVNEQMQCLLKDIQDNTQTENRRSSKIHCFILPKHVRHASHCRKTILTCMYMWCISSLKAPSFRYVINLQVA